MEYEIRRLSYTANIQLSEDAFGIHYDSDGQQKNVKRFTWKNHNNIEVQVITFGARITSIKMPNGKGTVEDIIMGFDDLPGYKHYSKYYFGATIGRNVDYIENAIFEINGQQHWLSKNDGNHHYNGGLKGFDKAIWTDFVDGTTLILSNVFRNKLDGYPGDLFVRIFFKLDAKNEFAVKMEAYTTQPTIVNLSNLLYVNLAGHHCGRKDIYKHVVTVNSNCFTEIREDGLPSGTITNVVHTPFDFQIPKLLSNLIGMNPGDGLNQHLCVNRGVSQDDCFVARILHPPSGRMLEIYSNQPGVKISTANNFPPGVASYPMCDHEAKRQSRVSEIQSAIDLVDRLHNKMKKNLNLDTKTDFSELRDLIIKIQRDKYKDEANYQVPGNTPADSFHQDKTVSIDPQEMLNLMLNPIQIKYLEDMRDITAEESCTDYREISSIIEKILSSYTMKDLSSLAGDGASAKAENELQERAQKKRSHEGEMEKKGFVKPKNTTPAYRDDGQIHGKNGAIYSRHDGICIQTQNYPNAIYHKKFPNSILRPGEIYTHTITYKFWIRTGNPNNFNKRYRREVEKPVKERHIS